MDERDAAGFHAQCNVVQIDHIALQVAIAAQSEAFQRSLNAGHAHLFAPIIVLVTADQVKQMQAVIESVRKALGNAQPGEALGVCYGFDFHLNEKGAHLIEINTNAGGAFLNMLLLESQRAVNLPGQSASTDYLGQTIIEMFRNEWRLTRGDAPLKTIAIVDERPEQQYLYPEFCLAKSLFEHAGMTAYITDPAAIQACEDGLYVEGQKIDVIYNRLTDFDLQHYHEILQAWKRRQVVCTPDPAHYQRYADKRKLVRLTDAQWLGGAGMSQTDIDVLLQGIPEARLVQQEDANHWWAERKQWFFKPVMGYGSKGAYRGDKITKRVFEEIVSGGYVAQRLAIPGECVVPAENGESQVLKYDVRCYVYDGQIQIIAARLYQGQTTNFRTPHGGFAVVRMVE